MARIDNVLSNTKHPGEYLVVRVDKDNILAVISLEETATVTNPTNLKEKNIVIICEDLVIAVATIKYVSNYDTKYSSIWKSKNSCNPWRSLIKFENVILLGDSIDNIFGKGSTIRNVQTVMNLRNSQELQSLINAINTFYLLNLNSYLSNIGIK